MLGKLGLAVNCFPESPSLYHSVFELAKRGTFWAWEGRSEEVAITLRGLSWLAVGMGRCRRLLLHSWLSPPLFLTVGPRLNTRCWARDSQSSSDTAATGFHRPFRKLLLCGSTSEANGSYLLRLTGSLLFWLSLLDLYFPAPWTVV